METSSEEKRVVIKPLETPEIKEAKKMMEEAKDESKKKMIRKKPGRKRLPPEQRKRQPKTNERHIMTDARKKGLEKARRVRMEKLQQRKAQKEQVEKIQAKPEEAVQEPLKVKQEQHPEQPSEKKDDVFSKLGSMEERLETLTSQMERMMSMGVFSGSDKQAQQTEPALPQELNHADFSKDEKSFVRNTNGGQTKDLVEPTPHNKEPLPVEVKYDYPQPFFF